MLKRQIIAAVALVALAGPATLLLVAARAAAPAVADMRLWFGLWLLLLVLAPLVPLGAAAWKKARLLEEKADDEEKPLY
ncbi:MAG: hypothetical protein Q4B96_03240 [Bacillota bacterium]|nr:hypothetical protein [Bacillota bacterium]